MSHSQKYENPEIKFGLQRNDNEINKSIINIQNGNKNWERGRSINNDWLKNKLEKKMKENFKEINNSLKNIKKEINENQMDINKNNYRNNELLKYRGKMFSFSKIPRFFSPPRKHFPGPSYYDPKKIIAGIKLKKYFNAKEEGWL